MNRFASLATVAVLLAGGLLAVPNVARADNKMQGGVLNVYDGGALFTDGAINTAKDRFSGTEFDHGLTFTVDTYSAVPSGKKLPENPAERPKFFRDWAKSAATGDKAKGVFVLLCRSPGYIEVIADAATVTRGFKQADEQRLRDIFRDALKESVQLEKAGKPPEEVFAARDRGLENAVAFVITDLKWTTPPVVKKAPTQARTAAAHTQPPKRTMGIAGWICLGLCVILCIWVVVALIRALTAPAYYGGPGYYGGGGFGTAFFGGMFGVMAGMWLYDSMWGTHYYDTASAADYSGG
ncbi:MAG TPA: hypothetical protein VGE74_05190, partial [Gemmata sp.]